MSINSFVKLKEDNKRMRPDMQSHYTFAANSDRHCQQHVESQRQQHQHQTTQHYHAQQNQQNNHNHHQNHNSHEHAADSEKFPTKESVHLCNPFEEFHNRLRSTTSPRLPSTISSSSRNYPVSNHHHRHDISGGGSTGSRGVLNYQLYFKNVVSFAVIQLLLLLLLIVVKNKAVYHSDDWKSHTGIFLIFFQTSSYNPLNVFRPQLFTYWCWDWLRVSLVLK